jgi:hypothetical protein
MQATPLGRLLSSVMAIEESEKNHRRIIEESEKKGRSQPQING